MNAILDYVFLASGLVVVLLALFRPPKWAEVKVEHEKLTLRLPSGVVLVLIGFVAAAAGLFFRYQDYETQLQAKTDELAETGKKSDADKAELTALKAQYDRLKSFDFYVNLQFPEPVGKDVNIEGLVRTGVGPPESRVAEVVEQVESNVLRVVLPRLNAGDRVFFGASRGDRDKGPRWRSPPLEVPSQPTVSMERQKQP